MPKSYKRVVGWQKDYGGGNLTALLCKDKQNMNRLINKNFLLSEHNFLDEYENALKMAVTYTTVRDTLGTWKKLTAE